MFSIVSRYVQELSTQKHLCFELFFDPGVPTHSETHVFLIIGAGSSERSIAKVLQNNVFSCVSEPSNERLGDGSSKTQMFMHVLGDRRPAQESLKTRVFSILEREYTSKHTCFYTFRRAEVNAQTKKGSKTRNFSHMAECV